MKTTILLILILVWLSTALAGSYTPTVTISPTDDTLLTELISQYNSTHGTSFTVTQAIQKKCGEAVGDILSKARQAVQ